MGAEGDGAGAGCSGQSALILPETLVDVVAVDREGEGVAGDGLDSERSAKDGAGEAAGCAGTGGAGGGREAGAGLVREARPGDAVGGLIVAVVADGGVEALADGVPDDRGCGVASDVEAGEFGVLHGLAAVHDGGHLPGDAGVGRIVEAHDAVGLVGGVDESAFGCLRNGGDYETAGGAAPGKASEAKA